MGLKWPREIAGTSSCQKKTIGVALVASPPRVVHWAHPQPGGNGTRLLQATSQGQWRPFCSHRLPLFNLLCTILVRLTLRRYADIPTWTNKIFPWTGSGMIWEDLGRLNASSPALRSPWENCGPWMLRRSSPAFHRPSTNTRSISRNSQHSVQLVTTIQTIHDTFLDQSSCPNVSNMPISMDQNPPLLLTPK